MLQLAIVDHIFLLVFGPDNQITSACHNLSSGMAAHDSTTPVGLTEEEHAAFHAAALESKCVSHALILSHQRTLNKSQGQAGKGTDIPRKLAMASTLPEQRAGNGAGA